MESFRALFEDSTPDDTGEVKRDSPRSRFSADYGWYHTISWVVDNTPNITEDQLCEWTAIRFLNRVQYLKHKAELEQFEANQK